MKNLLMRRKTLRLASTPVIEMLEHRFMFSSTLISGPSTTNEGSAYTLHLNIPSQSSANWNINWGDGSAVQSVAGTAPSATHTYTDGPAGYTISASVSGLSNPLDTSFGTAGKVTTNLGTTNDHAYRVLLQSDGKILVGGGPNFSVARYNADGSLDTTFGSGTGKVTVSGTDTAFGMAIQPDGKILIGGGSSFSLCRLNANGSVDTTFGSGGVASIGLVSYSGYDLSLLSSGKILMCGTSSNGNDFVIARYNSNGAIDTTFGTGGKTNTDFRGSYDKAFVVTTQSDGKILVGGTTRDSSSNYDFGLARYTANGVLDTTFGTGGKVITDMGGTNDNIWDLSVLSNGSILAAGNGGTTGTGATDNFGLVRYTSTGALDSTFGGGTGKVLTDFGYGSDQAYAMTLQPDGKILLSGRAQSKNGSNALDFAIARYNADGSIDTTFGTAGKETTDFVGSTDVGESAILEPDGDLIVAGATSTVGSNGSTDFALARYFTIPSQTLAVTVNNVPPTLMLSGASTINEGSTYTLGLASSDPGTDTISSWNINWGDGSTVQTVTGNPLSVTHLYVDGPLSATISATATDEDGTYTAGNTLAVSVANVAPTVTIDGSSNPSSPVVGNNLHFASLVSDPGTADTLATDSFSWTASLGTTVYATGTASSFDFNPDDAGTYTIALQVTDKDGGIGTASTSTLVVSDIPPVTTAGTILEFQDGNGTTLWDQYAGVSGNGWVGGWRSSSTSAAITAGVINSSPLNSDTNGNYLSTTVTASSGSTSGNARAAVSRAYKTAGIVNTGDPYQIQFDYRVDSSLSTFTGANDQVYIFGDDNTRFAPLTTDTVLATAFGAAQSTVAAKSWGIINAHDSSGNRVFVDSGVALATGTVYHFSFLIDPTNNRYKATITDGQTGAGHTYSSDWLGWDNIPNSTKTYIEAGARLNAPNESVTYSLDAIDVSAPTPPVPGAPTSLVATATSTTSIHLEWTDNSDNETGFTIQRATDANFTTNLYSFSSVADTGASPSRIATDDASGLVAGTQYFYRVEAINAQGNSAFSNTATATTPTEDAPQASVLVHTLPVSSTEVYVAWSRPLVAGTTTVDDSVQYYDILQSDNGSAYTHAGYAVAAATGAEIENLTPGDTYSFEVVAHNPEGDSTPTPSIEQVKTPLTDQPGYYSVSLTGLSGTYAGELTYSADGKSMHVHEPAQPYTYNGLTFVEGGYDYDVSLAGSSIVWANSAADALIKGFVFTLPPLSGQGSGGNAEIEADVSPQVAPVGYYQPLDSFYVPTLDGDDQHLDQYFDAGEGSPVAGCDENSSFAGDAGTNGAKGGDPVQYFDGSWLYDSTDLSSDAFGSEFDLTRSWKSVNTQASSNNNFGNNWTTSIPYLVEEGDSRLLHRIGVVMDGTVKWFEGLGSLVEEGGGTESLVGSGNGYIFTDDLGNQTTFYGFNQNDNFRDIVGAKPSDNIPFAQVGQFESSSNPYGLQTAVASYDSNGLLTSITRSDPSSSNGSQEIWAFSYLGGTGPNADKVTRVMLERATSASATPTVVQSVDYTYDDGTQAYGNLGDLMTATVNDRYGNAVSTNYYRYYTTSDIANGEQGFVGGLKYVFNDLAYAALAHAVANPLTSADSVVAGYATQSVEYDSTGRVTQLSVQGMGEKTPSSSGALADGTYAYTYSQHTYRVPTAATFSPDIMNGRAVAGFPTDVPNLNYWVFKTIETLPDGSQNTIYLNAAGQTMLNVFQDAVTGVREGTFYEYNSNDQQILMAEPSAVSLPLNLSTLEQYTDLLHATSGGAYQYLNNDSGLLYGTVYATATTAGPTTPGNVKNKVSYYYLEDGQSHYGSETESFQYFSRGINPLASDTVYKVDPVVPASGGSDTPTTSGSGLRTTTYAYTWNNDQPMSVTTTLPVISSDENGSGVAEQTQAGYDNLGRAVWTKDANGAIDYTVYDDLTGAVVKQIVDVNTSNSSDFDSAYLPYGWVTLAGAGLNLVTTYEVDDQGRTTKETDPTGNVTYTIYKDAHDPATGFVNEVRTYVGWHLDPNTGLYTSTGPVQVTRYNEANQYNESLTYTAPELSGTTPDGSDAITNVQTLERDFYNSAGDQKAAVDRYSNLSGITYSASPRLGSSGVNYYETQYGYDSKGDLSELVNPTGTIAQNVYDGQDRMTSTWVGTNDDTNNGGVFDGTNAGSGNNMTEIASYIYDNANTGPGTGDGNLTEEIRYPGNGQAARATLMYYDARDRLIAEKQGAAVNANGSANTSAESDGAHRPITTYTYDDLDEVTDVATYEGDGVPISQNAAGAVSFTAQRTGETDDSYDSLGQLYKKQTFSVDPSTGSVSNTALTAQAFYDGDGNVIASESTTGLWTKDVYDGAERVTEEYSTDGAGGSSFSAAGSVISDHVLGQTHYVYDGDGNVIEAIQSDRLLSDADIATGALGGSGPAARVSTMADYYDNADRLTASVDLGTNGSSFTYNAASVPARSDSALVTTDGYNDAGWVSTVTDPRNLQTRYFYDAAGRTTKEVDNYTNGTPTDSSNQTTQYTYDGDDNVTLMTAVMPAGTPSQTTEYVYGATKSRGDAIDSNDVLIATQYPDLTTGNASSGQQESYKTDAVGETQTFTDRNGTTHQYAYDALGRETDDKVTHFGTGVDQTVAELAYTYNKQGLLETALSYDANGHASVDTVNQVKNIYNGLGQLSVQYQSISGPEDDASTPSVHYGYSDPSTGSRLTSMTYPNGRVITYNYAGAINNAIGRLSSLSDATGTLQSYGYQGLSTVLQETDGNGIQLNVTEDAFGRTADQNWSNASSTTVDDTTYTYDRDGNVLTQGNGLNSSLSDVYTYDNLNRLTDDTRGGSDHQSWNLDALGNSSSVTTDGTPQSRTNNAQNQLTSIGGTSLTFDANGNETTDETGKTLVYDAWNHLVEAESGTGGASLIRYQYDALGHRDKEGSTSVYFSSGWQEIEDRNGSGQVTAQYVYSPVYIDAMIERDRDTNGDGITDERVYVLQNANYDVTAIATTSGTIAERFEYDAYGARTVLSPSWGSTTDTYAFMQGHQGGKIDAVTGFVNFRNRELNTTQMRWMQEDPLGLITGANRYRPLDNSPADRVDPTGLIVFQHNFWPNFGDLPDDGEPGDSDFDLEDLGKGYMNELDKLSERPDFIARKALEDAAAEEQAAAAAAEQAAAEARAAESAGRVTGAYAALWGLAAYLLMENIRQHYVNKAAEGGMQNNQDNDRAVSKFWHNLMNQWADGFLHSIGKDHPMTKRQKQAIEDFKNELGNNASNEALDQLHNGGRGATNSGHMIGKILSHGGGWIFQNLGESH